MSTIPATAAGCAKHMEYGPCGGVELDGTCEVAPTPCVFLDLPTVRWRGAGREAEPAVSTGFRDLLDRRPVVVADFPALALDAESIAACGAILAGRVDAVLAGDSGAARVQFSPTYRASLIRAAGLQVWSGVNCRDRNRVALEGELAGLAHVGVAGVHCVTGDHTLTGHRPDAAPVFDLDSTELASLARAAGHLVSVAESPRVPPVERRAQRLLEKERAGAEICFVDHAGGAEPVRRFIEEARRLGSRLRFIPCVPVVLDAGSAELLLSFTSLVLPEGYIEGILSASDPFAAGIDAAVGLSRAMLEIDGVVGVDLSGGNARGGELQFAEALATIGERILA
jgi:5,10-methylenetetrahydrofolate reductase